MVSREDVLRVAKLARIKIKEQDIEIVQKKFSAVLDYFKFLSEAKTENIAPLFHATDHLELRVDSPEEPLNREALLKNSPESLENCFKIPRVVGGVEE